MKKMFSIFFAAILSLGFISTVASADVDKGQKLIVKKLKKACQESGIKNGGALAAKHTQAEWTKIQKEGKLAEEIQKLCPKADAKKALKDKYLAHYYDFLNNYASDSGNVPS